MLEAAQPPFIYAFGITRTEIAQYALSSAIYVSKVVNLSFCPLFISLSALSFLLSKVVSKMFCLRSVTLSLNKRDASSKLVSWLLIAP